MHHALAVILLEPVLEVLFQRQSENPFRLTGDFVLHHTVATVVPERDFVVLVAIALKVPARRGAHAALGLAHLAVEVVVVPDVNGHNVVEETRTPHVCVHADARLGTGCHQDGRSENRLHFDGFGRLFGWMLLMSIVVLRGRLDDFLISIVVGGWMLMKLADMSSVSMLERLDVLYIIRPKIDAPYAAVSWWIN
jgi:hypothetical protein